MIWSEYYSTPSGESGYVWQLIIHWSNEQMIVLDGTMVQIHLYIYDAIVWLSDDKTITNSRIAFAFSIQVEIRYIWIQFMLRLCTKKKRKTIKPFSDIPIFYHFSIVCREIVNLSWEYRSVQWKYICTIYCMQKLQLHNHRWHYLVWRGPFTMASSQRKSSPAKLAHNPSNPK